jgi:hypothetical protein
LHRARAGYVEVVARIALIVTSMSRKFAHSLVMIKVRRQQLKNKVVMEALAAHEGNYHRIIKRLAHTKAAPRMQRTCRSTKSIMKKPADVVTKIVLMCAHCELQIVEVLKFIDVRRTYVWCNFET